ncbi:MAG: hypothetical protein AAF988_07000 [Pseudomonadota bacterium]
MDIFMMVLGVVGTLCIVSMYLAIQIEKISVNNPMYSWVNLFGAIFLLTFIAYDFDSADIGGVMIEAIWILVSLYGLFKFYIKKEKNGK